MQEIYLIHQLIFFWPGYVHARSNHIPHSIPGQIPGWSSLMKGLPLTPKLVNVLVATPALGSQLGPEYFLLVWNCLLASFGKSPKDRMKSKRLSKFITLLVEPLFMSPFQNETYGIGNTKKVLLQPAQVLHLEGLFIRLLMHY